jgi:hypothetical protein
LAAEIGGALQDSQFPVNGSVGRALLLPFVDVAGEVGGVHLHRAHPAEERLQVLFPTCFEIDRRLLMRYSPSASSSTRVRLVFGSRKSSSFVARRARSSRSAKRGSEVWVDSE